MSKFFYLMWAQFGIGILGCMIGKHLDLNVKHKIPITYFILGYFPMLIVTGLFWIFE